MRKQKKKLVKPHDDNKVQVDLLHKLPSLPKICNE